MSISEHLKRLSTAIGLGLACGSAAFAITSGNFSYSPAKTTSYMVSPADFTLRNSTSAYYQTGGQYLGQTSASVCFNAAIHLPHGAKVLRVVTRYRNSGSTDYDAYFSLDRVAFGDPNAFNSITHHQSTVRDDADFIVTNTATANVAVVNNATHKYVFSTCLGAGDRLYGARIIYRYTNAGS